MKKNKNSIKEIFNFFTTGIWRIRLKNLSRAHSFFIKQLRIVILALRGFGEDKCRMWASALTFYTMLAIVPVLAMAFGIAKGFGFEKPLEKQLFLNFPGQEEILSKIIDFSLVLLENTKGGLIAGVGIVILIWVVIQVLSNIEYSFNDIWGIKTSRSFAWKFSNYISIIFVCPLLLIMSSSLTVFLKTQAVFLTDKFEFLGMVSPLLLCSFKIIPVFIIWVLFSFIYILIPNTKVNVSSGFIGGIVGGTCYLIVQWAYIAFQVGVVRFNAIYGSFAIIPLFLIWLQVSWLIMFFGAEVSFAHQNVDMFEFDHDCLGASFYFKKLLALRITHLVVDDFVKGSKPLTAAQIGELLEIPIRLVRQILYELTECGVLSEVNLQEKKEIGYQPGKPPETLTIQYVVDAFEKRGIDSIPVAHTAEAERLTNSLKSFERTLQKSPANILIQDV